MKKKIFSIGLITIILLTMIFALAGCENSEENCSNDNRYYTNSVDSKHGSNSSSSSNSLKDFPMVEYKPIIYLYPEKEVKLSVRLGKPENITCSYPNYNDKWNITANPDGTLIDNETGRKLYALYWEGKHTEECNLTEGFVVKKSETIQFLEEKLSILGLTEREAEEFIIYWLPKLQENEYNYIRFATLDEINKNMPLEFSIEPDTLIRVLMQYKPLDEYIEVKNQELTTPQRQGFVAVEWGGMEIK